MHKLHANIKKLNEEEWVTNESIFGLERIGESRKKKRKRKRKIEQQRCSGEQALSIMSQYIIIERTENEYTYIHICVCVCEY